MPSLPRIAITHGDPNGVGYEVILKALDDERILELCTPVIYGSPRAAAYYRKQLGLQQRPWTTVASGAEARDGVISIVAVPGADVSVEPGKATPEAGAAALAAVDMALRDAAEGAVDAVVTAPLCKSTVAAGQPDFAGHTEYIEAFCNDARDEDSPAAKALMILCSENLRVALATTHLPLAEIPGAVTRQGLVDSLRTFSRALHTDFGCDAPRIAVLSLNPHAGDSGLLGKEEQDIIKPAIDDARNKHRVLAFGPYAADGFFGSGAYAHFDGVLAMYHDQGLTPFKTLMMDSGVNVTAGLPIVRTSPDHGTGFDIAGQGTASCESLRQAIYTAMDILRCRRRDRQAHRNPLRRQYHDKGNDNVVLDLSGE